MTKAEKENKKDEDHARECGIKMEEYVKEIKKLKALLQQKSEIHQLQEEEYRLKEEEFEKDMKTIISNKDKKIALMEEQLELSMKDLLKTEKSGIQSLLESTAMLSDEFKAVEYDRY